MKNLIFFAILVSALGCQAPKDRSGDTAKPPASANPNATDPNVKTQVEPRVIVLTPEELKIAGTKSAALTNIMQKSNLAEQSIEKTFTFENVTPVAVVLSIEPDSVIDKSECVGENTPVVSARPVFSQNDKKALRTPFELRLGTKVLVEAETALEWTLTVTNPGQCKNLSYSFIVISGH